MDRFLSITGALACIPLVFLLPAGLHLEFIAKADNDTKAKFIDKAIIAVGTVTLLYCSLMTLITYKRV